VSVLHPQRCAALHPQVLGNKKAAFGFPLAAFG
jgi:hypothetical protein